MPSPSTFTWAAVAAAAAASTPFHTQKLASRLSSMLEVLGKAWANTCTGVGRGISEGRARNHNTRSSSRGDENMR